jgi:hypothetical protein
VSVYVDDMRARYGRMIMCHMLADTPAELHAMADRIGVARRWFQNKASTPHYDIALSKRALAVLPVRSRWSVAKPLSSCCLPSVSRGRPQRANGYDQTQPPLDLARHLGLAIHLLSGGMGPWPPVVRTHPAGVAGTSVSGGNAAERCGAKPVTPRRNPNGHKE